MSTLAYSVPIRTINHDGQCPGVVPGVPLHELAATQAAWFRSWGTEAGDLFARTMNALAADILVCSDPGEALSVAEFTGRIEAMRHYHTDAFASEGF